MTPHEALRQYIEAVNRQKAVTAKVNQMRSDVIPAEVQARLDEISVETGPMVDAARLAVEEAKTLLNETAGDPEASTMLMDGFKATHNPGKYSFVTEGILGYAAGHPELNPFIKKGKAFYAITEQK